MSRIADFRHRIRVERPAGAPDGAGGTAPGFQTVCHLWAREEPLDPTDLTLDDTQRSLRRVRLSVRAPADVRSGDRVIFDGGAFAVTAARFADATRREVRLDLEARGGQP